MVCFHLLKYRFVLLRIVLLQLLFLDSSFTEGFLEGVHGETDE